MGQKKSKTFPKIGTVENYRHLWLLGIWILYFAFYILVEHVVTVDYWVSYLPLDDKIPFCEYMILPYCCWYPLLLSMTAYLAFWEKDSFVRFMIYIGIGFYSSCLFYLLFPNGQNLRPTDFINDSFFTRLTASIYAADTNTNVCPSMHVIGCAALVFACLDAPSLRKRHLQWVMLPLGALISVSTVFVKQHSILDLFVAIPYSLIVWLIVYKGFFRKKK